MKPGEVYTDLKNSLRPVDAAIFITVLTVSAAGTYALIGDEKPQNPAVQIHGQLNSSHDSMQIDFFNKSMEIAMETGSETSFYLYLYGEGNADAQLSNLTRDGKIRSSTKILDYPSGVYLLHYSYNVGPDEDHWLEPEKIEKLG